MPSGTPRKASAAGLLYAPIMQQASPAVRAPRLIVCAAMPMSMTPKSFSPLGATSTIYPAGWRLSSARSSAERPPAMFSRGKNSFRASGETTRA